jgi:hypothetical protein
MLSEADLQKKVIEIGKIAYRDGLNPDHFAKASSHLSPDDWEITKSMGLGFEKPTDKDHIYNVLTPDEINKICYERRGKVPAYTWYQDWIAKGLDVYPEWLPPGLVEAQLKLSEEKSYGKRSYKNYKNYLRRLEKSVKKGYLQKKQTSKTITFN